MVTLNRKYIIIGLIIIGSIASGLTAKAYISNNCNSIIYINKIIFLIIVKFYIIYYI